MQDDAPTPLLLQRVADALGVPVAAFYDEAQDRAHGRDDGYVQALVALSDALPKMQDPAVRAQCLALLKVLSEQLASPISKRPMG